MIIADVLNAKTGQLVTAQIDTPLVDLLKIMAEAGIGSIAATSSDSKIVGLITERSIIEAAARNGSKVFAQAASSVMRSPIPVCKYNDTVSHAMRLMTDLRTRHLLVSMKGDMPGIVSIGDLVKFRIRDTELENLVLRDIAASRIMNG